jgi:hypothetical protein
MGICKCAFEACVCASLLLIMVAVIAASLAFGGYIIGAIMYMQQHNWHVGVSELMSYTSDMWAYNLWGSLTFTGIVITIILVSFIACMIAKALCCGCRDPDDNRNKREYELANMKNV